MVISTTTYPYQVVLQTLLSYGENAKTSQLTSALFYKDQAGVMDSIEFGGDVAARDSGLAKRRSVATQSREFDMMVVYMPISSFGIATCLTKSVSR